jgi:hypothetical protein
MTRDGVGIAREGAGGVKGRGGRKGTEGERRAGEGGGEERVRGLGWRRPPRQAAPRLLPPCELVQLHTRAHTRAHTHRHTHTVAHPHARTGTAPCSPSSTTARPPAGPPLDGTHASAHVYARAQRIAVATAGRCDATRCRTLSCAYRRQVAGGARPPRVARAMCARRHRRRPMPAAPPPVHAVAHAAC